MQEIQERWVWSLGWEDPLKEDMTTHSSILAWRIPWTEEPGRPQSMGSQRVRHDWSDSAHKHHKLQIQSEAECYLILSISPSATVMPVDLNHSVLLPRSCPSPSCRLLSFTKHVSSVRDRIVFLALLQILGLRDKGFFSIFVPPSHGSQVLPWVCRSWIGMEFTYHPRVCLFV